MAANLFLTLFVVLLSQFLIALVWYYFWRRRNLDDFKDKKILFVSAHPDDECMFFSPTILQLSRCGQVNLLCLSTGDHYGLGETRKQELFASCALLGIPPENVTILNKSELQDSPLVSWDVDIVRASIEQECKKRSIDLVITFDGNGVSGHPNHIAIYNAIKTNIQDRERPQNLPNRTRIYILESTNILRKYISFLDLANSIFAEHVFLSSFHNVRISQKAMAAHESQFVWFRKLYIIFSRYMVINTLQRLDHR